MDVEIHINRKFTRHDLAAFNQPNPTADPMLIALLADGNDNGAQTKGADIGEHSIVCVTGIGQNEVTLQLCHYIASKGEGCEVYHAEVCSAFVEVLDDADTVPSALPGYTKRDDDTDWTWGEYLAQPTVAAVVRDGRRFIGAGTFAGTSTQLSGTQHLALTAAGVALIHPDDLPVEAGDL